MRERKIQSCLIDMDFASGKSMNAPEDESRCTRLGREYLLQGHLFDWAETNTNLSQNCRYSKMEITSQAGA
jgi:hypothetical protein